MSGKWSVQEPPGIGSSMADRFAWIVAYLDTSYRGLGRMAGISEAIPEFVIKGAGIKADSLAAVARAARVDGHWLLTGEGSPHVGANAAGPLTEEERADYHRLLARARLLAGEGDADGVGARGRGRAGVGHKTERDATGGGGPTRRRGKR